MTAKNKNYKHFSAGGFGTPTFNLKNMQVVASQTMLRVFLFDLK